MIAIPALDGLEASRQARSSPRTPQLALAARELVDLGFTRFQIADHSAREGSILPLAEEILRETDASVQVEGVSATSDIDQLLRIGVEQVVVGTRGIDEPEWLANIAALFPEAIAVSTDVHDRRVVRRGWVRTLPVDILDLVDELNDLPLREVVVKLRSLDASTRARDLALLEDVAERSRFPVAVSGLVATLDDCRALEHRGVAAAIIEAGRLLDGEISGRDMAREFGG
jgi:phosphoribosylformimino-5-aminoimidazole carboxamide ribotide isomerase